MITPLLGAMNHSITGVAAVVATVLILLTVDFVIFSDDEDQDLRKGAMWSLGWLILGLAAAVPLALIYEVSDGINYVTVYLVERTLSIDNLVVFLIIFTYFAVPLAARARLVFIGIALALILRGAAILGGIKLLDEVHFITYLLGLLLAFLAWRMWQGEMENLDPGDSAFVRVVRRFFPVGDYVGSQMFTRIGGRIGVTPLLLATVSLVAADIAFAVDSIPAALAITPDSLTIWMANGFALVGLRAMFVVVEHLSRRLAYLNETIAMVLLVIAIKLLIADLWIMPPALSLGIVAAVFAVGIAISLRSGGPSDGPSTGRDEELLA